MNEIYKKALELLRAGKKGDEVTAGILEAYPDTKSEDIIKQGALAQKAYEIEVQQKKGEQEEAQKKALEEQAKKLAEQMLESMDEKSLLEKFKKSGDIVISNVKESEHYWMKDAADVIRTRTKKELSEDDKRFLNDQREKNDKVAEQKYGIKASMRGDSNTDGGYLLRPEFDMEIDKKVLANSELINEMTIRPGDDKTLINSITGPLEFAYRANQETAFGTDTLTTAQQELLYREAGMIIPVSKYLFEGSEYNLISELMEFMKDAKIRLIEPLVCSYSVDVDGDPFDGIRFHTGVVAYNIIDANGATADADLTNMYLQAAPETRAMGVFMMDEREIMLLASVKDVNGNPKNLVLENNGWKHKATGKRIISVNNLPRTLNSTTDHSTGTDVFVAFGNLKRYRYYEYGGMDIARSDEVYWTSAQVGIRAIIRNKAGIPANSRDSFVVAIGAKNTAITQ